ncbi:hypothetical protein MHYP_G00134790 [Metynnis hypsauchen]
MESLFVRCPSQYSAMVFPLLCSRLPKTYLGAMSLAQWLFSILLSGCTILPWPWRAAEHQLHICVAAQPLKPLLQMLQCLDHAEVPHASHHMHHAQHHLPHSIKSSSLALLGVDSSRGTPLGHLLLSPSSTALSMLVRVLLMCTVHGPQRSIDQRWHCVFSSSSIGSCGTFDLAMHPVPRDPPTGSDIACLALPIAVNFPHREHRPYYQGTPGRLAHCLFLKLLCCVALCCLPWHPSPCQE